MWPFKRHRPCVYIIDIYTAGRETRRTMPVETMSNGDHVVRMLGDDALVLQSDGSILGTKERRWAVLDDIPGLTDDAITPYKLAEGLAKQVDELRGQLRTLYDATQTYRDAKNGAAVKRADANLVNALGGAYLAMMRAGRSS